MFVARKKPTQNEVENFIRSSLVYDKCRGDEIEHMFDEVCSCPRCNSKIEVIDHNESNRIIRCTVKTCVWVSLPYPLPHEMLFPPPTKEDVLSYNDDKLWSLEQKVFWQIKSFRHSNLPNLVWNDELAEAARRHAVEIANLEENNNACPNERIRRIPNFSKGFGLTINFLDKHKRKFDNFGRLELPQNYAGEIIELWAASHEVSKLLNITTDYIGVGAYLGKNANLSVCVYFAKP